MRSFHARKVREVSHLVATLALVVTVAILVWQNVEQRNLLRAAGHSLLVLQKAAMVRLTPCDERGSSDVRAYH